MTDGTMELSHLQRTVVIGNAGSGKSGLAQHIADMLAIPAIDLDQIHWAGDGYGERRDDGEAKRLVADASLEPAWVIEGVYGWLARVALARATALIWLDLSWDECRAGLMDRGTRRGMTDADHSALVAWAADYWTRGNANSHDGHMRLFEAFGGTRLRLNSRSDVDDFVTGLRAQIPSRRNHPDPEYR